MSLNSTGRWICGLGLATILWLGTSNANALDIPLTLGFSVGQEAQFKPPPVGQARATSLMMSPGYKVSDNVRIDLGISYIQDTYRRGKVDFEIRPNLMVSLPGYSYYGRINLGFVHLLDGETGEKRPSIGVALGRTLTIAKLPFFAEMALNPRTEKTKKDKFRLFWIAEARVGFTFDLQD